MVCKFGFLQDEWKQTLKEAKMYAEVNLNFRIKILAAGFN